MFCIAMNMQVKELRVRKYPRLKDYDYSQYGPYFVTFCVKDRRELLGRIEFFKGNHKYSGAPK